MTRMALHVGFVRRLGATVYLPSRTA